MKTTKRISRTCACLLFAACTQALAQTATPAEPEDPIRSATAATEGEAPHAGDAFAPTLDDARELDAVRVIGYRIDRYQGEATFDDTYIDALPRSSGDLATLLRAHPNVQIDEEAGSALAPGEIRPAEISINGAPYFQNAFLVDGVSFTNDLDPSTNNSPNSYADVPSATQGIALDTGLLERLTVYDSNVPAAFGRFNGGVIDAVTRRAGQDLSGSIALRTTRSAWTEYPPQAEDDPGFALSTTQDQQPEFEKYDLRARLEGRTDGGLGLLGNLSVVRSVIPLRGYLGGFESAADDSGKDHVRQNLSLLLKADYTSDAGHGYDVSTLYAPTDERYFIPNARDSYFDIRSGGPVFNGGAEFAFDRWHLAARLSYSDLDSSRRSDAGYFRRWDWSPEKNWGNPNRSNPSSIEGAWGDVDQRQREAGVRLNAEREAFPWGASRHVVSLGADIKRRHARYERLSDHLVDLRIAETGTCTAADGTVDTVACSLSPTRRNGRGQYFRERNIYRAGSFEVDATDYALFVQDDIAWHRLDLRPGLRIEGDDYMDKITVSPRLALGWDVFGDGDTRVAAGVNRYYGRTFFGNALREGRESLRETLIRGADLVYGDPVPSGSANRFEELDIPYADETVLGLEQRVAGFDLAVKWVHREGRDEILRRQVDNVDDDPDFVSRIFVYTNDGRSRSDVYTLSFAPIAPWDWGPTRHQWFLAADWTDVRRNYNDYDSSYRDPDSDIDAADTLVLYDGERIRFDELPAGNFNRPWTARLATRSDVPAWGLIWSNFLRYRSGYRDAVFIENVDDGDGEIALYDDRDLPDAWTLDTSLEWRGEVGPTTGFVRVEVDNVLDRLNETLTRNNNLRYDPGRQYWLEVGAEF